MAVGPIRLYLAVAIILLAAGPPSAQTGERAFKGWELYTWSEGGEWRFSLLIGTNRFKFCNEIRDPRGAMSLEQTEDALRRLAEIEQVYWLGPLSAAQRERCGVEYPASEIVARIRMLSRERGLHLVDNAHNPESAR